MTPSDQMVLVYGAEQSDNGNLVFDSMEEFEDWKATRDVR